MNAKQDIRHLESIARILEAVAGTEGNTVRAILACQDAQVALTLALNLGLTPKQAAQLHDRALQEMVVIQ